MGEKMQRPLGAHQSSVMDLSPIEMIEAAAQCGYQNVSLFSNMPVVPIEGKEAKFVFPAVTQETKGEVLARLNDSGLGVTNAEFFLIRPDIDLATYEAGLALGKELGASNAMTHVFETDSSRAVDMLGRFCELAAAEELNVAIEFCKMTPGCKTIHQAKWFVDQVGADNIGFGICPMHLVRSGGTAEDIAAIDARTLLYGQINDGKGLHVSDAYFDEVHDRELPGNGDFPLHDILSALPAHVPIEFKCPSDSRIKAGMAGADYLREAFARSRSLVDGLTPSR